LDEILSGALTAQDEEDVLQELENIVSEQRNIDRLSDVPYADANVDQLPDVPNDDLGEQTWKFPSISFSV